MQVRIRSGIVLATRDISGPLCPPASAGASLPKPKWHTGRVYSATEKLFRAFGRNQEPYFEIGCCAFLKTSRGSCYLLRSFQRWLLLRQFLILEEVLHVRERHIQNITIQSEILFSLKIPMRYQISKCFCISIRYPVIHHSVLEMYIVDVHTF